jgi:hypothetical protein
MRRTPTEFLVLLESLLFSNPEALGLVDGEIVFVVGHC